MTKKVLLFAVVTTLFLTNSQAQVMRRQGASQYTRPVFLEGTVLMDDGSKPADPIQVDLICHNAVFRQVRTSPGGSFSIQIGSRAAMSPEPIMDASVSSDRRGAFPSLRGSQEDAYGGGVDPTELKSVNLSDCRIYATLAGFQSDVINLGYRGVMENPDLGVIVLHRIGGVKGTTISVKTLTAPKRAAKEYEKAREELAKDSPDYSKAAEQLEKAVKSYAEFAAAWNMLGETRLALSDQAGAREAFEQSMAADENYVTPCLYLAQMEIEGEHWKEAADLTRKVVQLNPYIPLAHYFNAVSHYSLGELDAAEESIDYLKESAEVENFPVAYYISGSIMAQKGNLTVAAADFRRFLEVNADSAWAGDLERQLEEWEAKGLIEKTETSESSTDSSPQ
jgi:hypothetical protein